MSDHRSPLGRRRLLMGVAGTGLAGAGVIAGASPASATTTIPVLDGVSSDIPRRVFDSRTVPISSGGGRFQAGNDRKIFVDGEPGSIHSATYVFLNVTVTQTVGAGYLTVYRSGISRPTTSCVNWTGPNQTVGSSTLTACLMVPSTVEPAHESYIQIYCGGTPSTSTHVIVDLTARWRDQDV